MVNCGQEKGNHKEKMKKRKRAEAVRKIIQQETNQTS